MTLADRVLHGVLNRLFEKRDIVIEGELYLRRWFLKGRGTDEQWFLHNIRKPDAGRELHDHPWDFTTKILSGGYVERIEDYDPVTGVSSCTQYLSRRRGDEARNMAEHTHRIHYVSPGTYTLMKAGRARRTWGFWVTGRIDAWRSGTRWRSWRDYLGLPPDTPDHIEDRQ